MMLTLSEIKTKVDQLAQKIGAPQNILPTYGLFGMLDRPNVEVGSVVYYYVTPDDRGHVIDRYAAFDIDELLYKIFVSITSELSWEYALSHRTTNQTLGIIQNQHQIELLTTLSSKWAEKVAQEHEQERKLYRLNDNLGNSN